MELDIEKRLTTYIAEQILKQPDRKISPEEPILSSGLIDSFNLVDLALFVEDEFNVHVDDAELNSSVFDTVNQLVEIIKSRST